MNRAQVVVAFLCAGVACKPEFAETPALIDGPRVIGVFAEPPEAATGEPVRLEALFVDPQGRVNNAPVEWSFCAVGKPLTENNAVHEACLQQGVRPIATQAAPLNAVVPLDACALFGPDVPPDGSRPRDPDATGGFYQPVRVVGGTLKAFGFVRVQCNLANVSADVASEFRAKYVRNKNPRVSFRIEQGGRALDPAQLPAGANVTLRASWAPADAESFVAYDVVSQTLVPRREAMRVSWFSTAGQISLPASGRDEQDLATDAATELTLPLSPAPIALFAVLRDSRGGQAVASVSGTVVR
jgi:hypothetical protein